jgi:GNAT superfamily N-acetyltransferase
VSASVSTTEISPIDLSDDRQGRALVELLDHYARDPMGGGQPLAEAVRTALVPGLRQQPHYLGFLAIREGIAVGLVNAFLGFSTFAARPLLNLHDVVVHAAVRRQGIGRLLLDRVEATARARGCCKLTLEVLSANRAAREAYAAFGFASYAIDPSTGTALFLEKKLDRAASEGLGEGGHVPSDPILE